MECIVATRAHRGVFRSAGPIQPRWSTLDIHTVPEHILDHPLRRVGCRHAIAGAGEEAEGLALLRPSWQPCAAVTHSDNLAVDTRSIAA